MRDNHEAALHLSYQDPCRCLVNICRLIFVSYLKKDTHFISKKKRLVITKTGVRLFLPDTCFCMSRGLIVTL